MLLVAPYHLGAGVFPETHRTHLLGEAHDRASPTCARQILENGRYGECNEREMDRIEFDGKHNARENVRPGSAKCSPSVNRRDSPPGNPKNPHSQMAAISPVPTTPTRKYRPPSKSYESETQRLSQLESQKVFLVVVFLSPTFYAKREYAHLVTITK